MEHQVQFELNEADLIRSTVEMIRFSRFQRRFLGFSRAFGVVILCVAALPFLVAPAGWWLPRFALFVLAALFFIKLRSIQLRWLLPVQLRSQIRADPHRALLGEQRIEVGPGGIRRTHRLAEALVQWPAVTRLARSGGYLGVFFGTHCFAVPRRAFSLPDVEHAFCRDIEALSGKLFEPG
jgi:hypothetical protein